VYLSIVFSPSVSLRSTAPSSEGAEVVEKNQFTGN